MSITSNIAAVTRKLHSLAVDLHIIGLGYVIKGAEIRHHRAQSGMSKAHAVMDHAYENLEQAISKVNNSKVALDMTKAAAQIEARHIGGVL